MIILVLQLIAIAIITYTAIFDYLFLIFIHSSGNTAISSLILFHPLSKFVITNNYGVYTHNSLFWGSQKP